MLFYLSAGVGDDTVLPIQVCLSEDGTKAPGFLSTPRLSLTIKAQGQFRCR
jgi:hypothetical protein